MGPKRPKPKHDIFMTWEADGGRKKWEKKSGNMGELMGDKGKK